MNEEASGTLETVPSTETVDSGRASPSAGYGTAAEKTTFIRHVTIFSFANLLSLVCNGVLTFLLPKLLSMESYGYYRLFVLYGSFAGVLHLGLLDGLLIRWAARPQERMKSEVMNSLVFLLFQHATILLPAMTVLALLFRHQPWFFLVIAIAAYAVVFNVSALGQFALQADKLFGFLSLVTVLNPAAILGAVVALNRAGHLRLATLLTAYIGAWLVAGIVVWAVLLARYAGSVKFGHSWRIGSHNIMMGASVLLALLLTNITLSLDRIAVSLSFSIRDFAIYSLAASALAVVNTIILSVSKVVFPYLSDGISSETRVRAYWWGEACLIGLWALSLAGYFPLCWLIARLLPNYITSLPVLRLLMLTTGMTAVIYILHTNYFRSSYQLGRLLLGCTGGLAAAAAFLALGRRTGQLSVMALSMTAAIGLWWCLDELLLQPLTGGNARNLLRTVLVSLVCGVWFLYCSTWHGLLNAAFAYLAVASVAVFFAYRSILRTAPILRTFS